MRSTNAFRRRRGGRILGRRQALTILGMSGLALTLAGTGTAAADSTVDCVAKPEMTEGPYFVDEGLNRSDIRTDPTDGSVVAGTALMLTLRVLRVDDGCKAIKDAIVDIWHCDALGVYSDIAAEGTSGKKFLRGYQETNGAGKAGFGTILPGWYQGRTVHIHVKIRTTGTDGNPYEFTSQLYFTEEFKTAYLATDPYAAKGTPDTTNATPFDAMNASFSALSAVNDAFIALHPADRRPTTTVRHSPRCASEQVAEHGFGFRGGVVDVQGAVLDVGGEQVTVGGRFGEGDFEGQFQEGAVAGVGPLLGAQVGGAGPGQAGPA
jgi:protocatechuate 3,4-dioxygenase beta subunit